MNQSLQSFSNLIIRYVFVYGVGYSPSPYYIPLLGLIVICFVSILIDMMELFLAQGLYYNVNSTRVVYFHIRSWVKC